RGLSPSGSKVITDPGKLGPDLLELLLQRDGGLGHATMLAKGERPEAAGGSVRGIQPEERCGAHAPWHFLNFLPLPHQHGSLRPIFSRSPTTRCVAVATEPPPAAR